MADTTRKRRKWDLDNEGHEVKNPIGEKTVNAQEDVERATEDALKKAAEISAMLLANSNSSKHNEPKGTNNVEEAAPPLPPPEDIPPKPEPPTNSYLDEQKVQKRPSSVDYFAHVDRAPVPPPQNNFELDIEKILSAKILINENCNYYQNVEINASKNRFYLMKADNQAKFKELSGATIQTKGKYYPSKLAAAEEKEPPLYLHVTAPTEDSVRAAVKLIVEHLDVIPQVASSSSSTQAYSPLPSSSKYQILYQGGKPVYSYKVPLNVEKEDFYHIRGKIIGAGGANVKHIANSTNSRVQIKGRGSGFIETSTNEEADEPPFLHVTNPSQVELEKAIKLCEDLVETIHSEQSDNAGRSYQSIYSGPRSSGSSYTTTSHATAAPQTGYTAEQYAAYYQYYAAAGYQMDPAYLATLQATYPQYAAYYQQLAAMSSGGPSTTPAYGQSPARTNEDPLTKDMSQDNGYHRVPPPPNLYKQS